MKRNNAGLVAGWSADQVRSALRLVEETSHRMGSKRQFHVDLGCGCLAHRLERGVVAPLGVVDHTFAVETAVDAGGDEAVERAHGLGGRSLQQGDQLALTARLDREDVDQRQRLGSLVDARHGRLLSDRARGSRAGVSMQ